MRLHKFVAIFGLLVSMPLQSVIGQEDSPPVDEAESNIVDPAVIDTFGSIYELSTLEQDEVQSFVAPYFLATSNMLASSDGEYLAQDQVELQTYYDLGMTYRYIEEDIFRRQLKLPEEQGIAILTVNDAGLGQESGFQEGDIVLTVDEVAVDTQYDLVIAIAENRGVNQDVVLQRDGIVKEISINIPEATVEETKRYVLGVNVEPVSETLQAQLQMGGLVITALTDGQPAVLAGLRVHDIITHVDDRATEDVESLRMVLQESNGGEVSVKYLRAAKSHTITITPGQIADYPINITADILSFHVDPAQTQITQELMVVPQMAQFDVQTLTEFVTSEEESADAKIDRLLQQLEAIKSELEELRSEK